MSGNPYFDVSYELMNSIVDDVRGALCEAMQEQADNDPGFTVDFTTRCDYAATVSGDIYYGDLAKAAVNAVLQEPREDYQQNRSGSKGMSEDIRPLCPFCSKPWGDEAVKLFNLDAGDHCESGRFYGEQCSVSITCQDCGREMYRKEGKEFD